MEQVPACGPLDEPLGFRGMGRDIVLFLGAGFSRDAGLPVMSEFGDFSRGELSRIEPQKNEKKAAP